MKTKLKFVAFVAVLQILFPFFAIGQEGTLIWDCSVRQGTEERKKFKSNTEKITAYQIQENILSVLSTEELLDLCLRYPLLYDIFAFNDLNRGLDKLFSDFNGIRELYKREDVVYYLINRYAQKVQSFSFLNEEHSKSEKGRFIISVSALEALLSRIDRQENNKEVLQNLIVGYEEKQKNANYFKGFGFRNNLFSRSQIISKMDNLSEDQLLRRGQTVLFSGRVGTETIRTIDELSYQLAGIVFSNSLVEEDCEDVFFAIEFTPNGSPLETEIRCEFPIYIRLGFDDYYSREYDEATLILTYDSLSSTARFNCHGFAWIREEQGVDRWVEDPCRGVFMADGSYIEASADPWPYPAKVYWVGGGHSAITTKDSGMVISKWVDGPLMKHELHYNPGGPREVRFFVKAPIGTVSPYSISGSLTDCYSDNIFTLESPDSVGVIHWVIGLPFQGSNAVDNQIMVTQIRSDMNPRVLTARSESMNTVLATKLITPHPPAICGFDTICAIGDYALNHLYSLANWSVSPGFKIISESINVGSVTVEAIIPNQSGTLTATINGVPVYKSIQACNTLITGPEVICTWNIYSIPNTQGIEWSVDPPEAFELIMRPDNSVWVVVTDLTIQNCTLTATLSNGQTLTKMIEVCANQPYYIDGEDFLCFGGGTYEINGIDGTIINVGHIVMKNGVPDDNFWCDWDGDSTIIVMPYTSNAFDGEPKILLVIVLVETGNGNIERYYLSKTIQTCYGASIFGTSIICDTGNFSLSDPNLKANWTVSFGYTIIFQSYDTNEVTVRATTPNAQPGILTATINGVPMTKFIQICDTVIFGSEVICTWNSYSVSNIWNATWSIDPPGVFEFMVTPNNSMIVMGTGLTTQSCTITAILDNGQTLTKMVEVCSNSSSYIEGDDLLCFDGGIYEIMGIDGTIISIGYAFLKDGVPDDNFWCDWNGNNSVVIMPEGLYAFDGEPRIFLIKVWVETSVGTIEQLYLSKTINTCSQGSFSSTGGSNYIVYPNPTSSILYVLSLERSNFRTQPNEQARTTQTWKSAPAEVVAKYGSLMLDSEMSEQVSRLTDLGFKIIYPISTAQSFDEQIFGNSTNAQTQVQKNNTTAKYEVLLLNPRTAQQIFRRVIPYFDKSFEVDVSSLRNGLYTLCVMRDGKIVHTQTIRVER